MPSAINADNGVVSGTAGLKSSADNSGVLDLQTNGTTAISISASQVVTFANQPAYTGGTANGVLYLNGSKVVTTGSALTFNGTVLTNAQSSATSGILFTLQNTSTGSLMEFAMPGVANVRFGAPNSDAFVWQTFGSGAYPEAMRLNSTGLGIGNTSPAVKLDVVGGTLYDGNFYLTSQFRNVATSAEKGILLGYNNADTSSILASGYANGTGALAFWTQNGSTWGERMRLTTAGNLGVGTNSPTAKFEVAGTAGDGAPLVRFNTTSANNSFNWVSTAFASNMSAGNLLHFIGQAGNTKNAAWFGFKYISSGSNSNLLTMGLYGVDNVLNVNGNANVSLYGATTTADGVGITFPATQSASSNANCLDDYEEGTWTPVITGAGGGTLTYNFISGVYRKVGSMVYLQFGVNVASRSGGSGEILIDGLPFTSINRGGYQEPANALQSGGWTTPAYAGAMYGFVMNSMAQMRTRTQNNSDTPGEFTSIQAGTYFNCIMVYCAA